MKRYVLMLCVASIAMPIISGDVSDSRKITEYEEKGRRLSPYLQQRRELLNSKRRAIVSEPAKPTIWQRFNAWWNGPSYNLKERNQAIEQPQDRKKSRRNKTARICKEPQCTERTIVGPKPGYYIFSAEGKPYYLDDSGFDDRDKMMREIKIGPTDFKE